MKQTIGSILRLLLFFGLGIGLMWWVYHKQELAYAATCQDEIRQACLQAGGDTASCDARAVAADCSLSRKLWNDFRNVHPLWVILTCLAFGISNISRAIRWSMLIRPFGYKVRWWNTFLAVNIGYFANLGFPRLGEVLRCVYVSRYDHIPFEKVVGTVVVDRIVDFFSLLFITVLVMAFESDFILAYIEKHADLPHFSLGKAAFWLGLGFSLLFLFFYLNRIYFRQRTWYQKIKGFIRGFWEGLRSFDQVDNKPLFFFHSGVLWLMYFLLPYLCFQSYDPTLHLGVREAALILITGALAIVIPTPGGMGTYHVMVTSMLVALGIGGAEAFTFANILFFSVNILFNILLGLLSFYFIVRQKPVAVPAGN